MKFKFHLLVDIIGLLLGCASLAAGFNYAPKEEATEEDKNIRVYVRAYDYNTPNNLTLEKQGNYIGRCYQNAFPNATVKVSTAKITRQEFYDEIDTYFADSKEDDINYIVFTGHGSTDGYIFLHYGSGTKFDTIRRDHLDNIKGKIFLNVSACHIGRYFDSGFGRENFMQEIDAMGDKYHILAGSSSESTYIPDGEGPNADDCGKWASGLESYFDEDDVEHIKGDINDDGVLTVDELREYGLTSPNAKETYSYPRNDQTVIRKLSIASLIANCCDGVFYDKTSTKKLTYTKNTRISSLPVPIKQGYVFDGWYEDVLYENKVSFPLYLNSNKHIYAKWKKNRETYFKNSIDNYDTIRIPLKTGGYTDYLVIDKEHTSNIINKSTLQCESDNGMYLIAKNYVGTSVYYKSLDDYNNWDNSEVKNWLNKYYHILPDSLTDYMFINNVTVIDKIDEEKVFILTNAELKASLTSEFYDSLAKNYWWERLTSSSSGLPGRNNKSYWSLAKSENNLKASFNLRPAMNLNINRDDLYYDFEEAVYKIKFANEAKIEFVKPDKEYVKKINGEIVYTATGEIKACLDGINTLALVPWHIDHPIYYKYMGNLRSILQPGNYRGIPYANTYDRNFHDYENVLDAFAEGDDKVRGLECSSAVAYGIRLGLSDPKDILLYDNDAYDCNQYIADGLHNYEGYMSTVGGSRLRFKDFLTLVGNYGEYVNDDTPNSQLIIKDIIETANYTEGDIYTNVYAHIMPGDCLARHFHEEGAHESQMRSHAQLCTGVELFYDEYNNLDIQKSGVYFTDISAPHNSKIHLTGDTTAWTNDETVKSNFMSFKYMCEEGFVLPTRLNIWIN